MKKLCPSCKKQVNLKNSFCPYCGADISHAEVVKSDLPPILDKARSLGSTTVSFVKDHKKPVIIGAIVVLLIITIILASILGTQAAKDIFREKKVSKITIGMTEDEVKAILGAPSEDSSANISPILGNSMVYFEDKVNKELKKANDKFENAEDFDDLFEDMDKAYAKIEKMKYKSIVVELGYDKKVTSVALNKNTKYDEHDKYASWETKELKSFELSTNTIGVGETLYDRKVTYTAKYKDGSYIYGLVSSQNANFSSREEGVQTLTFSDDWHSYTAKMNVMQHNVFVTSANAAMGSVKGGGYYAIGSDVTVTAIANSNRTFEGWYNANGKKVSGEAEYTFKATNSEIDMNLTAKFTSFMQFNVSLNTNISGLNVSFTGDGSITEGYAHTIKLKYFYNSNLFFAGWYDGSECVSADTTYNYTMPASDKTFTAHFVRISYNKSIDEAGSINYSYSSNGDCKAVGDTVRIKAGTRDGYTWCGWYLNGEKVSSVSDYSFTVKEENQNYTAKWITCPINIDLTNGGYIKRESYNVLNGATSLGAIYAITAVSYEGNVFVGWYNGEEKLTTDFTLLFSMPDTKKTYTAKWIANPITLRKNISDAGTVKQGETNLGELTTITATTNNGYVWLGWYDEEDNKVSEGNDITYSFRVSEEAKTFIAKWQVSPITLKKNIAEGWVAQCCSVFGGEAIITATAKLGYVFIGWFEADNIISIDRTYSFILTIEEKTYTAKWELCNQHDIIAGVCSKCRETEVIIGMNNKGYYRKDDYIYFGYYPQTVKESNIMVGNTTDSDGYYLGNDGYRYAKVTAHPDDSGYKFSDNAEIMSGTIYYFQVEPIKWRILEEKEGNAFILCDNIIAECYAARNNKNNEYGEIVAWLNNEFCKIAFSNLQQELIQITNSEKVFFLTPEDVTNSAYGFSSNDGINDSERRIQTSDYSRAMGAEMSTDGSYYGNGRWWLRAPGYWSQGNAYFVDVDGNLDGCYVGHTAYGGMYNGVAPALIIRL